MRSPVAAILWETWRVIRVEAAWKLAFGIGAGLGAVALHAALAPMDDPKRYEQTRDSGAVLAMILLVVPHLIGWWSMAKLSGGRRGFPLHVHYTQPVRTAVLVSLPMAYLTAVSWAIYLASALFLRMVSGHPFPLLPVAAWIAALTLVLMAATWSTRSFQVVLMMVAVMKGLEMAMHRLTDFPDGFDWYDSTKLWPAIFDFPLTDYALIGLIGLASFGITVATVTGQRHEREQAAIPRTAGGGLWGWLVNLFHFPCPVSSPTRAQVWLDLKSKGLPMLTIGVALAIVILLMAVVSGPIDAAINADYRAQMSCPLKECFYARAWPPLLTPVSLFVILILGRNAFGIRSRQGRTQISAFEATQPHGATQRAVLNLLARSVCLLAALFVLGTSVSISMPLLGDPVFIQMWNVPLSSQLTAFEGAFAALPGYEQLALAVVVSAGVVLWVAALAVLGALRARYSRRVNVTAASLLLFALALALLALAVRKEILSPIVFNVIFAAARWTLLAAMVFTTVYLFCIGFAERALTVRYASSALLISAAIGMAWLTVLHTAGVQLAGMSVTSVVSILSPALLPPMFSILAPWSYSRIRHL